MHKIVSACHVNYVNPKTLLAVINVESKGDIYALNINKTKFNYHDLTYQQALEKIAYWILKGKSIDIGLMQLNSKELVRRGVPLSSVLNPCKNIEIGSKILAENIEKVSKHEKDSGLIFARAISMYNTGSEYKGFNNGYVSRYTKIKNYHKNNVRRVIPYNYYRYQASL